MRKISASLQTLEAYDSAHVMPSQYFVGGEWRALLMFAVIKYLRPISDVFLGSFFDDASVSS